MDGFLIHDDRYWLEFDDRFNHVVGHYTFDDVFSTLVVGGVLFDYFR